MSEAGPSTATYPPTSTTSFPRYPDPSPLRPSLFELLADDQLRDLLHPVVKYVLTYFTHRYPRYLLRVLNHHEEFFACLLLIIERHHLKRHSASLSEHFYQLRVVPDGSSNSGAVDTTRPPRLLSRKQRWGLLFFLVGVPYIRARAQDYYERLGGGLDPENLPPDTITPSTLSQKLYKRIYPYLNLSIDLAFLSHDMAYLFRKTEYYRPWHRLLRVRIERDDGKTPPSPHRVFDTLPSLIPPLLLLLKLSSWWYSPQSPRALVPGSSGGTKSYHASILPPRPLPILPSSGLLPLTPPPSPPAADTIDTGFKVSRETYGECPLCEERWQNPAVLPSGWVVCWKCGYDAVEGEDGTGKCPITGVPVAPGELRRVLL